MTHDVAGAAEGVGVIVPPPELRKIVETTVRFVAKKQALEAMVLARHNADLRFSFLKPGDPYHAYYRAKLAETRAHLSGDGAAPNAVGGNGHSGGEGGGGVGEIGNGATVATQGGEGGLKEETAKGERGNAAASAQADAGTETEAEAEAEADVGTKADEGVGGGKVTTKGKAVVSFLKSIRAKEAAARPEPRVPPNDDVFTIMSVNPPPLPLGLEVMKLSAQFAAKSGREFVGALRAREARNSLFDFLKPMHPHFIVFQRLVDAYRLLLEPGEGREKLVAQVRAQAGNERAITDEVWYMHDWECQRAEREHEAALDEGEKLKAAAIDWHDFVVLETVDLDEDEEDLPAPVADARQLPKILAAAKKAEAERHKNQSDVDMDVDARSAAAVATKMTTTATTTTTPPPLGNAGGSVVTADVDSDIPAHRIRRQAAPQAPHGAVQPSPYPPGHALNRAPARLAAGATAAAAAEATVVVLPSGQRVPLSKAEASVHAELLDPSYKDERARAAEKNRLQNLAGGEEMARNLARWGQARSAQGSVYNRADLQDAVNRSKSGGGVAGSAGGVGASAEGGLRAAPMSGPQLPRAARRNGAGNETEGAGGEAVSPPTKRARVDAAVDALSGARAAEVDGRTAAGAKGAAATAAATAAAAVAAAAAAAAATGTEGEGGEGEEEERVGGRVSGEEWMRRHGRSATVRIKLPVVQHAEWDLQGQEMEMSAALKSSVGKLKAVVAKYTKLPANRQKLQMEGVGFLKDRVTLAQYNVTNGAVIVVEVKERGGRRKRD